MPFYQRQGRIPAKRHITFYKDDGKTLYREELASTYGFSGIYSNKYHHQMPTKVLKMETLTQFFPDNQWSEAPLQYYHFMTEAQSGGDFIRSRAICLQNKHCAIGTFSVTQETTEFFRNAYAHEMHFIHKGSGLMTSEYGQLDFTDGDYIIIPKGCTYRLEFKKGVPNKVFFAESDTPFDIPKHYRNEYGQMQEGAPFSERDINCPQLKEASTQKGEHHLILKAGHNWQRYTLEYHPFDVVGWDGYLYPYTFNIKNFEPKVASIHLPPPVHLVFSTQNFVVCNFVPRPFDFHPQAIPAPYYHSNHDSDEVIYYADGNFMSRSGIVSGSITLHPMGIPHGPQPGKTEASVGLKDTYEYAVMIDTFQPLQPTTYVRDHQVAAYSHSWVER